MRRLVKSPPGAYPVAGLFALRTAMVRGAAISAPSRARPDRSGVPGVQVVQSRPSAQAPSGTRRPAPAPMRAPAPSSIGPLSPAVERCPGRAADRVPRSPGRSRDCPAR
jgi:hypothetical protein